MDGCSVYRITCLVTGKIYFGVTRKTLAWRWKQHVKESRATRFDTVLYRAMRHHGPESFRIDLVYDAVNAHEAQMVERALIAEYGSLVPRGLNTSTGGESHAGRRLAPEIREKISRSKRGKKMSAEIRAAMSVARKGKKRSAEVRARMKELANRPEVRENFLAHLNSDSARKASSAGGTAAMKLLWQRPEFRAKRAADIAALNARKTANKKVAVPGRGKHGAMIARWQDPAYREKMIAMLRSRKKITGSTAAVRAMVMDLPCDYIRRAA